MARGHFFQDSNGTTSQMDFRFLRDFPSSGLPNNRSAERNRSPKGWHRPRGRFLHLKDVLTECSRISDLAQCLRDPTNPHDRCGGAFELQSDITQFLPQFTSRFIDRSSQFGPGCGTARKFRPKVDNRLLEVLAMPSQLDEFGTRSLELRDVCLFLRQTRELLPELRDDRCNVGGHGFRGEHPRPTEMRL